MLWDDLRYFLVVARSRTLSAAARELKVAQPTVGRRIAALERQLGAKLFTRRSDGFELSASGQRLLPHAEQMECDAIAAARLVSGRDEGVQGRVRLTAAEWVINSVVVPLLSPLLSRHPNLEVELLSEQRHVNLARREADIALRPRRFEHNTIVQRATCKLGFGIYATPGYIAARGMPCAGDGRGHVLVDMLPDVGDVARAWLAATLPGVVCAICTNGRDTMLAAAKAGIGLACLARVVGDADPTLFRVPLTPALPAPTLWMGTHRDGRSTPRVRALTAHLAAELRARRIALCPPDS